MACSLGVIVVVGGVVLDACVLFIQLLQLVYDVIIRLHRLKRIVFKMGAKLKKIKVTNIGCIGSAGLEIELDNIVCLTGINNVGKSTLLDAYTYAYDNKLPEDKRCQWNKDQSSTIELWFDMTQENRIATKWTDGNGIAHFKWEWNNGSKKSGTTGELEGIRTGYVSAISKWDKNPSGLDNVFKSYLPKPIRIKSLDIQTDKENQDNIFKVLASSLLTQNDVLKTSFDEFISKLENAFNNISSGIDFTNKIEEVNKNLSTVLSSNLTMGLDLTTPDFKDFKLEDIISKATKMVCRDEQGSIIKYEDQGTGTQRAIFWSLIQLFSKPRATAKSSPKKSKEETAENIQECKKERVILLIDEPENALHPNAIKNACNLLYQFSEDENRQVMLTTHSPYFINPQRDHTTIVRLEKKTTEKEITNHSFRAKDDMFSKDERDNLKQLLAMDTALCEVFFGGYPIIIEGATEYLAFQYVADKYKEKLDELLQEQKIEHFKLVRAEGKDTIIPIAKVLGHFQVPFSVLHDLDIPETTKGNKSSAWGANTRIWECLDELRNNNNVEIGHLVSNHTFETQHNAEVSSKDKPWKMLKYLEQSTETRESVKTVLFDLLKKKNEFETITSKEELEAHLLQLEKTNAELVSV